VGLTNNYGIMVIAITIAILVMIFLSEPLSLFINQHPTIKMLAFSFLMMIGMVLVADGLHFHIPRGYVYFAIAFSIFVEVLNSIRRKRYP
jgi:predicted tellurium resistance membrane protein TerC